MADKLNMTEAQVLRQGKKIQEALFEKIVEEADDGYVAELKSEVIEIFQENLVFDEGMDEAQLGEHLKNIMEALAVFVLEQTKGVNKQYLQMFLADFISQTMSSIFRVEERESEPDDNMMYG
tara:strand:- start:15171 stop:15536 length:366 start_codon:yes stop_codon:yes gene_type:complete